MKNKQHKIKQSRENFSIPKFNLKRKGIPLKYKLLVGLFTILFLSGSMFAIGFYACQWYYSHVITFQSPIVFRSPITIVKARTTIVSPMAKMNNPIISKAHAEGIIQIPSWKIMPSEVNKEEWNYIMSQPEARLVSWIWKKESNYGRDQIMRSLDNYCRSHGQENQFGLGGMRDMTCFDTFEDNVQAVIKTLESYGKMDEKTMGCYYNLGLKISNCPYMANY